jgi:hypothetical protein
MARGVCPNNRPKWIRCIYYCGGTMHFTRIYRQREVWKCARCGKTYLRRPYTSRSSTQ